MARRSYLYWMKRSAPVAISFAMALVVASCMGLWTKEENDALHQERARTASERLAQVASREFSDGKKAMQSISRLWEQRRKARYGNLDLDATLAAKLLAEESGLSEGDLAVADKFGKVLVDAPMLPGRMGSSVGSLEGFKRAMSEGQFFVSGPWRATSGGPSMAVAAWPLRSPKGEIEGALLGLMRWDKGSFAEALVSAAGMGKKAVLIDQGGSVAWGSAILNGKEKQWSTAVTGTPWLASVYFEDEDWYGQPGKVGAIAFVSTLLLCFGLWTGAGALARRRWDRVGRQVAFFAAQLGRDPETLASPEVPEARALADLKWAEIAMEEQKLDCSRAHELFEALAVASGDGVFVCRHDGSITPSNTKFDQLSGGAKKLEHLASPGSRAELVALFEQAAQDQGRMRWEGSSNGGESRRIAIALIPLESQKPPRFLGSLKDVSERSRMEMRLTFERDKAERVMEAVNEAVLYLDGYGHIERASAGMLDLLGAESSAIKGVWVGKVVRLADRFDSTEAPLEEMLTQEKIDSDRWLIEGGDGVLVPVELRWRKLREDSFEGVLSVHDISARVEEVERIKWEANHDALTGLLNRRAFTMCIEEQCIKMGRDASPVSLLMVDLDGFKLVNDKFGHEAGDEILKRAADALQAGSTTFDVVARLGGDEFALLLPGVAQEEAQRRARALREAIMAIGHRTELGIARVDASIGVAALTEGDAKGAEAMSRADQEMYGQKNSNKNRQACA